ncbi:MAG: DNA-3-methyladenine glycosylase I [Acidimicrobiales bacterium]|jgi:DNA-3-methyladenine glycosylase I
MNSSNASLGRTSDTAITRCAWAGTSPEEHHYHDTVWGVPQHDDNTLFQYLTLEGAQAGLSWVTILRKKQGYIDAFANFDPKKVANFSGDDIETLLDNPNIVRHRGKIESTISNARAVLDVQKSEGSFSEWLWSYVDETPVQHNFASTEELPSETERSRTLAKALKRRGFRFVGPTTAYAFMQASGMVNDHIQRCFRHAEVTALGSDPS